MVHEFHLIHVPVDLLYVEFKVRVLSGTEGNAAELEEGWC